MDRENRVLTPETGSVPYIVVKTIEWWLNRVYSIYLSK